MNGAAGFPAFRRNRHPAKPAEEVGNHCKMGMMATYPGGRAVIRGPAADEERREALKPSSAGRSGSEPARPFRVPTGAVLVLSLAFVLEGACGPAVAGDVGAWEHWIARVPQTPGARPSAAPVARPAAVNLAQADRVASDSRNQAPLFGILSETRIGGGEHDAGVFGRSEEDGYDINFEMLFVAPEIFDFMWSPRPTLGVSGNTEGNTSLVYGALTWEWWFFENFFANFSFGFAVHDGKLKTDDIERKELGSRVLFRESIDLGWNFYGRDHISLYVDHVSHGHVMSGPNEGMDTLGVRYGYRF